MGFSDIFFKIKRQHQMAEKDKTKTDKTKKRANPHCEFALYRLSIFCIF